MDLSVNAATTQAVLTFNCPSRDTLQVRLAGDWKLSNQIPPVSTVLQEVHCEHEVSRITFDTRELGVWDSGLLTFLLGLIGRCTAGNIFVDKEGLPQGVRRLLDLATAVPERKGDRKVEGRPPFLAQVGDSATAFWRANLEMLEFIGDAFTAFLKLPVGKARFRPSDLFLTMQACGAQALPIVSLISLLVGLILAFIGAIQLKIFGAQIYVASLVDVDGLAPVMQPLVAVVAAKHNVGYIRERRNMLRSIVRQSLSDAEPMFGQRREARRQDREVANVDAGDKPVERDGDAIDIGSEPQLCGV